MPFLSMLYSGLYRTGPLLVCTCSLPLTPPSAGAEVGCASGLRCEDSGLTCRSPSSKQTCGLHLSGGTHSVTAAPRVQGSAHSVTAAPCVQGSAHSVTAAARVQGSAHSVTAAARVQDSPFPQWLTFFCRICSPALVLGIFFLKPC